MPHEEVQGGLKQYFLGHANSANGRLYFLENENNLADPLDALQVLSTLKRPLGVPSKGEHLVHRVIERNVKK